MNQAILINDDLTYDTGCSAWHCTAFIKGELVSIYIEDKKLSADTELTDQLKFDLEIQIEDWFADNDVDDNAEVWL